MSSYHINDLDNSFPTKTYSFLPNNEKDENGENLMTQSLVIQAAPYRRIRHPELVPVVLNRDSALTRDERSNHDIMSQSLIVPPYRRTRHTELTPVQPKDSSYKSTIDVKARQPHQQQYHHYQHFARAPKRAFSMTRLDQLARPRQRYLEEALKLRASKTKENLCSAASVRPTSSMSLAPKQTAKPADHSTAHHNSSGISPHQSTANGGTLLLRQRTSARKQRPVSYAGHSIGSSNQQTPSSDSNLDQRSPMNHTSSLTGKTKAKLPFAGVIGRNLSSANSSSSARHSLMVSSIDGSVASSLTNSGSKPTPPRKPAHIKAASAARKLAKQQDATESDRMRKSESSPRISQQLEQLQAKRSTSKDRMKKSVTNPEKIADLLSDQPSESRRVIRSSRNKQGDRLEAGDLLGDDRPSEPTNASIDLLIEKDRSPNSVCQLIDLGKEAENVSGEMAADRSRQKEEEEQKRRKEEEEQKRREEEEQRRKAEEEEEQRRLENEEMRRRAADEERKRLAREEKERELERRAKEKAEKARLEMEERLKKDEQERIERKRRLESIMSRTRKNAQSGQQQAPDPIKPASNANSRTAMEQDAGDTKQNPDVVEDAIKSNLIKLTTNDNLNNSINNGKSDLHNFMESETIIEENKNFSLLNGLKEMKMSTNSTFVFSQTSSQETFTPEF